MSVRLSAWNNSAATARIFMKFDISLFSENLLRKYKFRFNMTRMTDTLHEDHKIFLIISRSVLLTMGNVSDKIVEENKTHILCVVSNFCFW